MACINNGSIFFFRLSVLLLNLYLSFLLLLKFLLDIKWGVGMRFKTVIKYYDMQKKMEQLKWFLSFPTIIDVLYYHFGVSPLN